MSQPFKRVAQHLYRRGAVYYAIWRADGHQHRVCLKTGDRMIAASRLRDRLRDSHRLDHQTGQWTFADLVTRWTDTVLAATDLKPSSRKYRLQTIAAISKTWPGLATTRVREITEADCEQWLARRKAKASAQRLNNEIGSLKMLLAFACREGVRADNPAINLRRVRIPTVAIQIPTPQQFQALLQQLIETQKNQEAAWFVELLAYSGMRLHEASQARWSDVDWTRGTMRITGGERGTKNRRPRTIPLFPALRDLLERMPRVGDDNAPISTIASCRYSVFNACDELGFPRFTHHDFRHLFVTTAIEAGINYRVIAEWVGHSDGGILVAKVYGHLRKDHEQQAAEKMVFFTRCTQAVNTPLKTPKSVKSQVNGRKRVKTVSGP